MSFWVSSLSFLAAGRESSESCAARLRNLKQTGGIAVRNYVTGGDAACFLRLQSCTTYNLLDSRSVASRLRKNDGKGVSLRRCARMTGGGRYAAAQESSESCANVILGQRPRIHRVTLTTLSFLAAGRESSESCAARLRNLKQTGGIAARVSSGLQSFDLID
jgi:hypothetical protein